MGEVVVGQKYKWQLLEKIGEGDAGEVWLVRDPASSLEGVIKRPSRGSYGSDIYRQAAQIALEGAVLSKLCNIVMEVAGAKARIVRTLDHSSVSGNENSNTFIVLERASGFDMPYLGRLGNSHTNSQTSEREGSRFLQHFANLDKFPPLLIYRMVATIAKLLIEIHQTSITFEDTQYTGTVWNDIKLDHIFWDPLIKQFTIIDWGNAQLLGDDGVSADRRYSRLGDYQQFCTEIRQFLNQCAPELVNRLSMANCDTLNQHRFLQMASTAQTLAEREYVRLERLRAEEKSMSGSRFRDVNEARLAEIQNSIIAYGEAPDDTFVKEYWQRVAQVAVSKMDVKNYRRAMRKLGVTLSGQEGLVEAFLELGQILNDTDDHERLHTILAAIADKRWVEAFWDLSRLSGKVDEASLSDLQTQIRMHAGIREPSLTPLAILRQAYERYTAQKRNAQQLESLRTIIDAWTDSKPRPSPLWLDYQSEMDIAEQFLSGDELQKFSKLIQEPQRIASEKVSNAWKDKNFVGVRQSLAEWILHDPDRKRIETLATYVSSFGVKKWLKDFASGPDWGKDKHGKEFAEDLLKRGAEFRIASGASWLDDRLAFLRSWADGEKPQDLLTKFPKLMGSLNWLDNYLYDPETITKFYDALMNRNYDDADQLAESPALIQYPGYKKLSQAFRTLENDLFSLNRSELNNLLSPGDHRCHSRDTYWRRCIDLYNRILKWNQQLEETSIQVHWGALDEIRRDYPGWLIVGGLFNDFRRWKRYFSEIANLPGQWRLSEGDDLPQAFREAVADLGQTLNLAQKCQQGDITEPDWQQWRSLEQELQNAKTNFDAWLQSPSVDRSEKFFKQSQGKRIKGFYQYVIPAVRDINETWSYSEGLNKDGTEKRSKDRLTRLVDILYDRDPDKSAIKIPEKKGTGCFNTVMGWLKPLKPVGKAIGTTCVGLFVFGCMLLILFGSKYFPPQVKTTSSPTTSIQITMGEPIQSTETNTMEGPGDESIPAVQSTDVPPSPTSTPPPPSATPDPAAKCLPFAQWSTTGDWKSFGRELSLLEENKYQQLQADCNWDYSYRQMQLEVGLLEILTGADSTPEIPLRQILSQVSPGLERGLSVVEVMDYLHWLRTSLALCHLPDSLTETQKSVLRAYLPTHLDKFDGAQGIFDQVCGSHTPVIEQIILAESETLSVLAMQNWDEAGESSNCVTKNTKQNALHWDLNLETSWCALPLNLTGIPLFEETTSLEIAFCLVDNDTAENVKFSLWTHHAEVNFGLQLDVQENSLINAIPQSSWSGFSTMNERVLPVPANQGSTNQVLCAASNYLPTIRLQPVWIGNLMFWRMESREGDELSLLPIHPHALPATTRYINAPLDFYWALDTHDVYEDDPPRVHIYIPWLEIERRK